MVGRLGEIEGNCGGENFRFGRGAKGNIPTLKSLGKKYGFEVETVKAVRLKGKVVSSSLIRDLLAGGKNELAGLMLGRPYSIEGEVVHGRHGP